MLGHRKLPMEIEIRNIPGARLLTGIFASYNGFINSKNLGMLGITTKA